MNVTDAEMHINQKTHKPKPKDTEKRQLAIKASDSSYHVNISSIFGIF
jgi:hypothetical protein